MLAKQMNEFSSPLSTGAEGVVLLDLTLKPIALDGGAATIFRGALKRQSKTGQHLQLPDGMLQPFKDHTPEELQRVRVQVRVGKQQYLCRAYLLRPSNGFVNQPLVALHILRDDASGDTITKIAAEYDLTERERETLVGLSLGLTCKEMAQRMNISPNTVKAFLRLVMIKMGVTRRGAIVTKLLEYNGNRNDHSS